MTVAFAIVMLLAEIVIAGLPSREVSKGNESALAGQSDQAQYHYVKALEFGADTSIVMYNLGNVMYNSGEYDRAVKVYGAALDSSRSHDQLRNTFYNLGNSHLQAQKYDEAIASYIEALRHDPTDMDAKQNLELALKLRRESQNQQEKQDQNQQEKSDDQKQEQKNESQSNKQDDKQPQQDQDQAQQNEQQPADSNQSSPEPVPQQQMSKEEAEQLLNALLQDEQNTLEHVRKAKVAQRKKRVKDW